MRTLVRVAWAIYALGLSTGTHWPQFAIEGPIPRTDVVIHLVCFGGWSALFIACGFFGEPLSRRNVVRAGLIAAAFSVVDELTQGIPGINRVVDPFDALANVSGALIPAGIALWIASMSRARARRALRAPSTDAAVSPPDR